MELLQLLVLVFLAAAVWLWLDSLKVREIGVKAAQRACADEGLQFLDDTVAIRSLRLVREYDINNDMLPCRVDVLYGYKTLRPDYATRLHYTV